MVKITIFGYLYLLFIIYFFLFHGNKILILLILSSVVQAASIINIEISGMHYGVSPFIFTALIILISEILKNPGYINLYIESINLPFALLCAYILISIAGSFLLPNIFAGISVVQHDEVSGFVGNFKIVKWGLLNFVQSINLILNFSLSFYLINKNNENTRNYLITGLFMGFLLVFSIGIYERLVLIFDLQSLVNFWSSNPSYTQHGIADGGLVQRIGIPFSEPSYNSAYIAGFSTASLALVLWGKRFMFGLCLLLASIFLTINTMGVTGILATIIAYIIIIFYYFYTLISSRGNQRHQLSSISALFSLSIGLIILLYFRDNSYIESLINLAYQPIEKIRWQFIDPKWTRLKIDINSLGLIFDTYGFGVGMGTLRASSFFVTLLASSGLLSGFLWILFLYHLAIKYYNAKSLTDHQLIAIFALFGSTLAMFIGIPDLNLPMYWTFIFLAFVFCPDDSQKQSNITREVDQSDHTQKQRLFK